MPDRADKKYPYYVRNKDFYVFDWGFLLESVFVFFVGAHGYAPLREDKAISGYFRGEHTQMLPYKFRLFDDWRGQAEV